jgi:hypothetical protein
LTGCRRAAGLAIALLAVLAAAVIGARADTQPDSNYFDAVQHASDLLQGAAAPDTGPAVEADHVLKEGTGGSQPEFLADLEARPPLYGDARARLSALLSTLLQPMAAPDPALAQQRLHDVMSMSRYDALHRPPNLIERFVQWVQDRISQLLHFLFGRAAGAQPPAWWVYGVGVLVVATVVFVLVRASRGRFGRSIEVAPGGPRPPADFFAEADRRAAAGDRVGAIRALCAAVAGTIAGERSWEGSPLTVREIFSRAPDSASLRPLLLPFEAAVYGGRDVDDATYRRAAEVAQRFRPQTAVAA